MLMKSKISGSEGKTAVKFRLLRLVRACNIQTGSNKYFSETSSSRFVILSGSLRRILRWQTKILRQKAASEWQVQTEIVNYFFRLL